MDHRTPSRLGTIALLVVLAATGCSTEGLLSGMSPPPTPSGVSAPATPSPPSVSPEPATGSPIPTPTTTESPGTDSSGQPSSIGPNSLPSIAPTGAVASACPNPTPVRVNRASTGARRTTDVVTVVSDGHALTTGSREQNDFTTPALTGPEGTRITDSTTTAQIALLLAATSKYRVLLERPESPDARADVSRKPFDTAGTYVLFNASSVLTVDVQARCGGQEQRWVYTAEADPTTGLVNCAVKPPRSNGLASALYATNCE